MQVPSRKLQERQRRREERKKARALMYAQLRTVIDTGRGNKGDDDDDDSDPPSVGSPRHITAGTARGTAAGASGRPPVVSTGRYINRDRRLPTIFAEQRQMTHNIDVMCSELKGQVSKMEGEFNRRRRALQAMPLGEVRSRLVPPKPKPHSTAAQLEKCCGRSESPREGDVSGNERGDGASGDVQDRTRRGDIERVRVAAADEGLRDDQSVADYAAEPDIPMYCPGRTLRDEVEAMEPSIKKVGQCMSSMILLEEMGSGNPWWDSAMLVREMKASSIRANYHVRNILKWIVRAQEHFLMEAVSKNTQSARCGEEMVYMREQVGLFCSRIEHSRKLLADVEAETVTLKNSLNEVSAMRNELLEKLLKTACESNMLPEGSTNVQYAELITLLEYTAWPLSLQEDVDRVKAWVRSRDIQLDA